MHGPGSYGADTSKPPNYELTEKFATPEYRDLPFLALFVLHFVGIGKWL